LVGVNTQVNRHPPYPLLLEQLGDTSNNFAIDRLSIFFSKYISILSANGSSRRFFAGPFGRPSTMPSALRLAKAYLVRALMKSG
jgi:hypothetical protein